MNDYEPFEIKIKTSADLKAVEDSKRQAEELLKTFKDGSEPAQRLQRDIAAMEATLGSTTAQMIKQRDAVEALIEQYKRTGQDTSALDKLKNGLDSQIGPKSAFTKLKEQAAEVQQAYSQGGGGIKGFLSVIGDPKWGTLAVGAAGIGMAAGAASKALREFGALEQASVSLDTALASRNRFTQEYRKELQELAGEMEKTTNIADDQWLGAMARLTQFGAKPEQMKELIEGVKNLAGMMGTGVESAAMILSRAMNGSSYALSRYGIKVKEGATESEKLTEILEQLRQRGMGQLEDKVKTVDGAWGSFKVQVGNVWEGLGNMISRTHIVQGTLRQLGNALEFVSRIFPQVIEPIPGINERLNSMVKPAKSVEEAYRELTGLLNREELLANPQKLVDALTKKYALLKQSIDDVREAQQELLDVEEQEAYAKIDASDMTDKQKRDARSAVRRDFTARKAMVQFDSTAALLSDNQAQVKEIQQFTAEDLRKQEEVRKEVAVLSGKVDRRQLTPEQEQKNIQFEVDKLLGQSSLSNDSRNELYGKSFADDSQIKDRKFYNSWQSIRNELTPEQQKQFDALKARQEALNEGRFQPRRETEQDVSNRIFGEMREIESKTTFYGFGALQSPETRRDRLIEQATVGGDLVATTKEDEDNLKRIKKLNESQQNVAKYFAALDDAEKKQEEVNKNVAERIKRQQDLERERRKLVLQLQVEARKAGISLDQASNSVTEENKQDRKDAVQMRENARKQQDAIDQLDYDQQPELVKATRRRNKFERTINTMKERLGLATSDTEKQELRLAMDKEIMDFVKQEGDLRKKWNEDDIRAQQAGEERPAMPTSAIDLMPMTSSTRPRVLQAFQQQRQQLASQISALEQALTQGGLTPQVRKNYMGQLNQAAAQQRALSGEQSRFEHSVPRPAGSSGDPSTAADRGLNLPPIPEPKKTASAIDSLGGILQQLLTAYDEKNGAKVDALAAEFRTMLNTMREQQARDKNRPGG